MSNRIFTSNPQNDSILNVSEEVGGQHPEVAIPNEQKPSLEVQDYETLGDAVGNGDLEGVKRMMEKEDRIPRGYYGPALVWAAQEGFYEIVKYLIEFKDKSLPESQYKNVPIVKILHRRGDLYNAEEALKKAIQNGHVDIVKYLVKQKIRKFSEVLSQAAKTGNLEMVTCLVENIGELTRIKKGALDEAAYKAVLEGNLAILEYLVEHGANINVFYSTGYMTRESPLSAACRLGNLEIVKLLVRRRAYINAENEAALLEAVAIGNLEIVMYLVNQGADIHDLDEAALFNAAREGHLEIVSYLVRQGADIHAQEERALIAASRFGHLGVVQYLVEHGANIYAQKEQALRDACANSHINIVKYLVYIDIVKYLVKQECACSCKN